MKSCSLGAQARGSFPLAAQGWLPCYLSFQPDRLASPLTLMWPR
jgi:hypothetical protein